MTPYSTSRQPDRCHHITDPDSYPPSESLPCVLCEIRQRVDRLPNRDSSRTSQVNFLQPQVESCISERSGMWYVNTDTIDKEGLSETNRPDVISEMRSNHPKKTKRLILQNPLWVLLLLRLEGTHLRTQDGVFDGDHYVLL